MKYTIKTCFYDEPLRRYILIDEHGNEHIWDEWPPLDKSVYGEEWNEMLRTSYTDEHGNETVINNKWIELDKNNIEGSIEKIKGLATLK